MLKRNPKWRYLQQYGKYWEVFEFYIVGLLFIAVQFLMWKINH
jgi:hypothetical protein